MASVAFKKARSGLSKQAGQALQDLADLRLTCCEADTSAQFELARRLNITAYGAAYLRLAVELRTPLATIDGVLGKAASAVLSKV